MYSCHAIPATHTAAEQGSSNLGADRSHGTHQTSFREAVIVVQSQAVHTACSLPAPVQRILDKLLDICFLWTHACVPHSLQSANTCQA
jgi:hypothetical protein